MTDLAAWVTAAGTIALVIATGVLAYLTWLLSQTRQPFVVATIEPSPWAIIHFNLHLVNEGSSTAFDIRLVISPRITTRSQKPVAPFSQVSALRSGQRLTTYIGGASEVDQKVFSISLSWSKRPNGKREALAYELDMHWLDGLSEIGGDPSVKAAQDLRKIREKIDKVVDGDARLAIDVYDASDRDLDDDALESRLREQSSGS